MLFSFLLCLISLYGCVYGECPLGWDHYDNSCFYFSRDPLTWYSAQSSCRGHNARLAEVYTKELSDFLIYKANVYGHTGAGYWLGGQDDVIEGRWIWSSSDLPFTYTAWAPNEPNNLNNNEDCLQLFSFHSMTWNDTPCDNRMGFICEREYPGGSAIGK